MYFISDNQDIFELLDLYVQVNIHKIKIEKQNQQNDQNFLKSLSIHSFQGAQEECSSVVILPQQIIPGSVAEKQLELLLQETHQRKKEYNDFEYKISLIFSKEKIYEFNKQYVQKMPTINKQLEWVCQPKKDVKILIQHAEQENQIQNLFDNQDNESDEPKKQSVDPESYEVYEMQGLTDDFVVVDSKINKIDKSSILQGSYLSKNEHSSFRNKSHTGSSIQDNLQKQKSEMSFFQQQSVREEVQEENNEEQPSNYNHLEEYQHIGLSQDDSRYEHKKKSILFKIRTKIRQYFSLTKSYILTYRIVKSKILNNISILRIILFFLIATKLLFFWLILIYPLEEIIMGESNTYDNVLAALQASIYPFASLISVFYAIVWILKQDISSGKKCMILNTMEIINLLIIMPLTIPQIILETQHWRQLAFNLSYFICNLTLGFIGSIYLLKNQEQSIQISED